MKTYQFKGETVYLIGEQLLTEQDYLAYEKDRQERDWKAGYNDRLAHTYDKWYRYNRDDEGAAYDRGVHACVNDKHSKKWLEEDDNFHIIECIEACLVNTTKGIKVDYYINKERVDNHNSDLEAKVKQFKEWLDKFDGNTACFTNDDYDRGFDKAINSIKNKIKELRI